MKIKEMRVRVSWRGCVFYAQNDLERKCARKCSDFEGRNPGKMLTEETKNKFMLALGFAKSAGTPKNANGRSENQVFVSTWLCEIGRNPGQMLTEETKNKFMLALGFAKSAGTRKNANGSGEKQVYVSTWLCEISRNPGQMLTEVVKIKFQLACGPRKDCSNPEKC